MTTAELQQKADRLQKAFDGIYSRTKEVRDYLIEHGTITLKDYSRIMAGLKE